MKFFKSLNFQLAVFFILVVVPLCWIAVGDEFWYLRNCKYKDYTIEVQFINGSRTVINRRLPEKAVLFVSCSHTCNLYWSIPSSELMLLGGHSRSVRDGVIDFKILN